MSLKNSVLNPFLDKFVIVFIDAILVNSKRKDEHDQCLQIVLQTLRENELYVKFRKYSFYKNHIHYLGHVVSEEGIDVDSEKRKVIMEWLVPKDVANISYFMGIIGYYIRFVEVISKLVYPITCLHNK